MERKLVETVLLRRGSWVLAASLLLWSVSARATILPENTLYLEDGANGPSGISEEDFNGSIERLNRFYAPYFLMHGGQLVIRANWSDSTVNAYASRNGNMWMVDLFGGLARRPEITRDAFELVICHEIGHHLGGYPHYLGSRAAAEGQADWYATQYCARSIWRDDLAENARYRDIAPAEVRAACDAEWTSDEDQNLCYRTAMAGKALAQLLAVLEGSTVDFSRPDQTRVSTTVTNHPRAQCRLDTYFMGGLCTVAPDMDLIPGSTSEGGPDSVNAELEAAAFQCMPSSAWISTPAYNLRDHPRCWFKPQLNSEGGPYSD